MFVLRGELDRARVAKYLLDSFATLRPQHESFVWHGWQSAIAMLGLKGFSARADHRSRGGDPAQTPSRR
jgi:hypothetical protein